jgi:hypothetical protein
VGCQNDDASFRELATNGADGIDTAHLRHLKVHQSDVRTMRSKLFERLASIGSLRDELHICLIPNQRGNAFAQKWMVIYGQHSNHRSTCFLPEQTKQGPAYRRTIGKRACDAQFNFRTGFGSAPDLQLGADLLGAFTHS